MKSIFISGICLCTALAKLCLQHSVTGAELTGNTFALDGKVTVGGGSSTGGSYALSGVAYSQSSGFYTGGQFEMISPPADIFLVTIWDVNLQIRVTGAGQALISWPASSTGYHLEFTTRIGPGAVWQEATMAPPATEVSIPLDQSARFFRLVRPSP
jgi:hypothetical protein